MSLSSQERVACDEIAGRREELVALASDLIGFDTTARVPGDPPRQEATAVIDAIRSLRDEWARVPEYEHLHLSRPDLLPTMARAGEWAVTYPGSCELTVAVMYLPAQADVEGGGSAVRAEVERWLALQTAPDDRLADRRSPTGRPASTPTGRAWLTRSTSSCPSRIS